MKDLHEQVGQLLVLGFEGTEATTRVRRTLTALQPAGVILFARNMVEAQQTHALLRECQKCATAPLFRCVDMEGGVVERLHATDLDGLSPLEALKLLYELKKEIE